MALYEKLDAWSIDKRLDEIVDYMWRGNAKDSVYWDFYSEQINEMSILAADMNEELHDLYRKIDMSDLPYKNLDFYSDDESNNGTSWFNTAAAMLSDIDMAALMENEEMFNGEEDYEKQKRIRVLERLTKKQQMWLYAEVIGYVIRYLKLDAAFETIVSVIRELDYHQTAIQGKNGETQLSQAAYL